MNILALDTSGSACSAALLTAQDCYYEYTVEPRAHTRLILPMVERVLQQAELKLKDMDALAFGCGPGAFTGVRIATGIIQGLALAADKPVVPVSTLAALAQQAHIEHHVQQALVAVDARMDEVYWGAYIYRQGEMQLVGEETVLAPEAAVIPSSQSPAASAGSQSGHNWTAVGSGWQVYQDTLKPRFAASLAATYPAILPHARYIATLAKTAFLRGEAVDAAQAQPVYLRNKVAQTTQERAAARP